MTVQLLSQCAFIGFLLYLVVSAADGVAALYFTHVKMNKLTMILGVGILFTIVIAGLFVMDYIYLQITGVSTHETCMALYRLFPDPFADLVAGTHWAL